MKSSDPIEPTEPAELEIHVNPDGAPPPKRRRVERKPRTTEYLDLSAASHQSGKDEELLEQLTHALRKKKKIVVIAGAGISVSAGSMHIPSVPPNQNAKLTGLLSPRLSVLLGPLRDVTQGTRPQRLRKASI
jgi:hypothetical protein